MTYLGIMKCFLCMEVLQYSDGIFMFHQKYILDILNRFKMQDCEPMSTQNSIGVKLCKDEDFDKMKDCIYRILIGNLLYLTANKPDIRYV